MEEFVILVDEHDQTIGKMEKLEAHKKNLRHRAFSVILFDENKKMVLQQRAMIKYHSPGLWTNACCGHPRPGEDCKSAAIRRTREELGIDVEIDELYSFKYYAQLQDGLWENEFDHVFVGTYTGPILNPNPMEVSAIKSVSLSDIKEDIEANPNAYTFWFKLIMEQLELHLKK